MAIAKKDQDQCRVLRLMFLAFLLVISAIQLRPSAQAQSVPNQVVTAGEANQSTNSSSAPAPVALTLQDALERAKKLSPEYRTAVTAAGLAKEDRVQSRAGLLPSANFNGQFLYTQGTGTSIPRFIANNGVHEYVTQVTAGQTFSLAGVADYRRTVAAEAVAKARAEIAARGLVVTVVQAYYGFVVAQRKYATGQSAFAEAQRFFGISQKLEQGGEVARSDVIKAQIQLQQQQRDLQEAELEMNRSRVELAVLVFPDFSENFSVIDDLQMPQPLPTFDEVQAAAANRNPDLRAAVASLREANAAVKVAWNGFLPALTLDTSYGIDSARFATRYFDPVAHQEVHSLGYAASATLQLPIWNWGANRSVVKQANLRREQAHVELTFAQRRLLANLRTLYDEARTARSELELLSQSAELAADSLRLITLRYQAGEALVLEVVDAQNTLTLARNAFNDGQVRYRVAMANVQTLTGNF
jgi:outer membrane protein TolC